MASLGRAASCAAPAVVDVPVDHVYVSGVPGRESPNVVRGSVVLAARGEQPVFDCKVVGAHAHGILGEKSAQTVEGDPSHRV